MSGCVARLKDGELRQRLPDASATEILGCGAGREGDVGRRWSVSLLRPFNAAAEWEPTRALYHLYYVNLQHAATVFPGVEEMTRLRETAK
jgi:hypothetical protein